MKTPVRNLYTIPKQGIGMPGTAGQIRLGRPLSVDMLPTFMSDLAGGIFKQLSIFPLDNAPSNQSVLTDSYSTNNLTAGNVVYSGTGILGEVNKGAVFNGINSYLESSDIFWKPVGGNNYGSTFAVGFWFKLANTSQTCALFSLTGLFCIGNFPVFTLQWSTNGLSIISGMSNVTANYSPPDLQANEWHHVVFLYDTTNSATQGRLYFDGRLVQTVDFTFGYVMGYVCSGFGYSYQLAGTVRSNVLNGSLYGIFFYNPYMTAPSSIPITIDSDIRKLVSYRCAHSLGIKPQDQDWKLNVFRGGTSGPAVAYQESDWIVEKNANEIYWDLMAFDRADYAHIRCLNLGA